MNRAKRTTCMLFCMLFLVQFAHAELLKMTIKNEHLYARETVDGQKDLRPVSALKESLEAVSKQHKGVLGLSLKHLKTGETVEVNGDVVFPTASTIKLAVMCAVFDELTSPGGIIKDYYETRVYDAATSTGGSGFLQKFRDGSKIELKELLHFMITVSDNVATNMLVEWLGLDRINNWLINHGFEKTRMNASIGGRIVWNQELREDWGLGMTTPNEMAKLMEMIATGKAGTTSATDEMMRLLGHQYFDGSIPAQVPPTVWVGSKSGSLNKSRSDIAVVASPGGMYVLAVLTKENEDTRWGKDNEAENNIREISRLVFQHYNPDITWSRPEGAEKF